MQDRFRQRSFEKELLDNEDIPFSDIEVTLKELHTVNTYLGGYASTQKGLEKLILHKGVHQIKIADIGCGGGDSLIKIAEWCRKNNIKADLVGIDMKPECIQYAQENTQNYSNIRFITSDYRLVSESFDIIHSSLFTHHLDDQQLSVYLNWAKRNSTCGVIINDLHRHFLAYYSIKYITAVFSKSYLVRNDACLSVLRSFTKEEWKSHAQKTSWKNCLVLWNWAFRYTTVLAHE